MHRCDSSDIRTLEVVVVVDEGEGTRHGGLPAADRFGWVEAVVK